MNAAATPWATGLVVTALVSALTAVGVFAFGAALLQVNVVVAVAINLIAVIGSAPTVWRWRATPVWRWVVYGLAAGVALAWIGLLFDAL